METKFVFQYFRKKIDSVIIPISTLSLYQYCISKLVLYSEREIYNTKS